MSLKNPTQSLIIGLSSLAFALVWTWAARRLGLPEKIADLTSGFFLGIGIGFLLLTLALRRRRASADVS